MFVRWKFNTFFSFAILVCCLGLFVSPVSADASLLSRTPSPQNGSVNNDLEFLKIDNVGYIWQTVALANSYTSAVPVCTYNLPSNTDNPAAIRIRNIISNSFEIKIQQPPDSSIVTPADIYCIIAEEGYHTLSDGRSFEAHKVISTTVSGASGWSNGEDVSGMIAGSYANPAVLGQVISYNNADFSVFWSYDCDNRSNVPFQSGMSDGICVGRHLGEISGGGITLTRNAENLGYIVIEGNPDGAGGNDPAGTLPNGVRYETAQGGNSIDGVDNSGASYTLTGSGYTVGVATQMGMNGNNGGAAVLYGNAPLAGSQIDLAIDEDTLGDTERSHTNERVAYWVFESDPGLSWMETQLLANVGASWQLVSLSNDYNNMVPVCTYNLPSSADNEAFVRIRNIDNTADSFEIRLQQPRNSSSLTPADVHCVIIEEGTHTLIDQNPVLNRTLEAHITNSDQFNENDNWNSSRMENVGYTNTYTQPVVLGQVITFNDSDFSLFWSSNGNGINPPDASALYLGKHVGEDPGSDPLSDEILGFIVIEGGSGFVDGYYYEVALGIDSIAGVGDSPPYSYTLTRPFSYGAATQEAEDGGNGGWAVFYGSSPFSGTQLNLAIEEETAAGDSSRTHTQEQVAYWVFDPVVGGTIWEDPDIDGLLESGETGLSNISVWFCPSSHSMPPAAAVCQNTASDSSGNYEFRAIASGDYYFAVVNPSASQSSTAGGNHAPDTNDQVDDGQAHPDGYSISQSFTYAAGSGSTNFDFGFADNIDIGGTVWLENDGDGSLDAGEIGLNNVTAWLCPSSHSMPPSAPVCQSTTTDSNGDYYFRNFASGDYYFAVDTSLPGLMSTAGGNHAPDANDQVDDGEPHSGGNYIISQNFTHVNTTSSTNFDFGFVEAAEIGGLVWLDLDGDGIQNAVVNGVSSVAVEIFDTLNISQGTTTTAADGTFSFSPLLVGDYTLQFTLPSGYLFSPAKQGGDDALDSDPDRTTGRTGIVSVAAGTSNTDQDAGIYPQGAHIFDPPSGYKTAYTDNWPVILWRHVWINDSNIAANLVRISDAIPVNTTYVQGSLTCYQEGSSSATDCYYDSVNELIVWEGTIAADPGAQTEDAANNEVIITFATTIAPGFDETSNQASAHWDENGDDTLTTNDNNIAINTPVLSDDPSTENGPDATIAVVPEQPQEMPNTGFAPGVLTSLPSQSPEEAYSFTDFSLEIPSLGLRLPIVGVPVVDGEWNVSWLGRSAGYLSGTAFPTLPGNTVLTAHVYDANGRPGPFAKIRTFAYGDQIKIHTVGSTYVYEVRENYALPASRVEEIFRPEAYDKITLITCEGFNAFTGEYHSRRVVRAVLVKTCLR
jgi:LPXTG-site transpeptidase (sortase) family protein